MGLSSFASALLCLITRRHPYRLLTMLACSIILHNQTPFSGLPFVSPPLSIPALWVTLRESLNTLLLPLDSFKERVCIHLLPAFGARRRSKTKSRLPSLWPALCKNPALIRQRLPPFPPPPLLNPPLPHSIIESFLPFPPIIESSPFPAIIEPTHPSLRPIIDSRSASRTLLSLCSPSPPP